MNIGFMSYFDTESGYGNSAVEMCRAISRAGHSVTPYAYKIGVELPQDFVDLFTKREPETLDAMIVFALPNQMRRTEKMIERIPIKIGFSMWEQTRFPKDLWVEGNPYNEFTELWVPCEMNVEPFQEFAPCKNIEVMPLGIDTDFFRFRDRRGKADKTFRYCMNGALGYRKGAFLVIDAYRQITAEHPDWEIELHLKTSGKGLYPEMETWARGLKVFTDMWWKDELLDFYHRMDCMVAPSRGEGFHQPPLEFASTGGIVITSTWGGMAEWYDEDWAYGVETGTIEVGNKWPGSLPGAKWGDPDPKSVKEQMENVYLNQDEAYDKAIYGSGAVRALFDWNIVVEKMIQRLEVLHGQK